MSDSDSSDFLKFAGVLLALAVAIVLLSWGISLLWTVIVTIASTVVLVIDLLAGSAFMPPYVAWAVSGCAYGAALAFYCVAPRFGRRHLRLVPLAIIGIASIVSLIVSLMK